MSLPNSDLEIKIDENGNNNAYDGEKLVYSWDGSEWVEYSPYNIVREAGKESEMSRVEWGVNSFGGVGVPAEYIDYLRENMLPGKLKDDQTANINYLKHWWGIDTNLEIGVASHGFSLNEVMQIANVCKVSLEPWGVAEDGYLMTYQYTNGDNTQSLVHFLLTKPYYQKMVDSGIFDGQRVLIPSGVIGSGSQSYTYPEDEYSKMVENFYIVQLRMTSDDARKHMEKLVEQVSVDESMVGNPELIIWMQTISGRRKFFD